jgi:hypothetical protein
MAGNTITFNGSAIQSILAGTQTATQLMSFSNANGITFGMTNSNRITLSYDGIRSISAGTTNATGSQIVFTGAPGISFNANGATISASLEALSFLDTPGKAGFAANAVLGSSNAVNLSLQRLTVPMQISATEMDVLAHLTVVGSTAGSYTFSAALYTFAASTANSVSSISAAVTWNSGTNSTGGGSIYGGQSGTRWRTVAIGTWNITPGEYLLGVMVSIAGVAGTTGSMTMFGGSSIAVQQAVGTNVGVSNFFADGVFASATGAFPSSIALSAVQQSSAVAMRQPYVRFAGTS